MKAAELLCKVFAFLTLENYRKAINNNLNRPFANE